MAFHAMADGDEIAAAFDRIGEHRLAKTGLGVGVGVAMHRRLVDRLRNRVLDRLDGVQIGDHRVEIVRQQRLVEIGGHHGASATPARWP